MIARTCPVLNGRDHSMPQPKKAAVYPPELQKWLDAELIRRGFADYTQLAVDLVNQSKLIGKPVEASKSALGRYGKDLKLQLQSIKDTTRAMAAVAEALPDDAAQRSGATIAMIETGLFEVMYALRQADAQSDPGERLKLLTKAGKAVSELTRASVALKKYQEQVRAKVQAAADAVARIGKKGGLSKAGAEEIRRQILGIAA